MYTYIYICIYCIYMYMSVYMNMYMNIHTYIYIYIYMYLIALHALGEFLNCCTGRYRSQFQNSFFAEMCSGSEAGSYLRLIDVVYHSTLGSRVIKKKKKGEARVRASDPYIRSHSPVEGGTDSLRGVNRQLMRHPRTT